MQSAIVCNKPPVANGLEQHNQPPLTAADVRALVEEVLRQRAAESKPQLHDFKVLCERVPLSPRSIRHEIKEGRIPHIRLPGARRLLFDWNAVHASLLRYQRGGIEN